MKKILFIIRGCPGAGKTSVANSLASNSGFVNCPIKNYPVHSADDYFYENGPNKGEYDFDVNKLGHAHSQCKRRVSEDMIKNVSKIFVANTFTREKEVNEYIKLADKYGYIIFSLVVENRHGNSNVHNVPEETMKAMEERFSIKLR